MSDFKEQKAKAGEDVLTKDFPDYDVVEHRIGNQTNAEDNHNKFFSIELHKSSNGKWRVYTNYGRVEDKEYTGAVGIYGPSDEQEMRNFFEKKFSEKVRPSKGYLEVKFIKAKVGSPKARNKTYTVDEKEIPEEKKKKLVEAVSKSSVKPTISLHPTIKKLINQWYDETSHGITSGAAIEITKDGISTPLGVLTFGMVEKGRKILGEIGQAIKDDDKKEIKALTSNFYSIIPTKLGRKITDSDMINSDSLIQQKIDLLDMMDSALEVGGSTFISSEEQKYLNLGISAHYLDKTDKEYIRLERKVQETRASNHSHMKSKVKSILAIDIPAETSSYDSCKVSNETELWHGSRNCNILGILKKGILIAPPEAPVSGYMFGKGKYLASASTKSLNYSLYSFSGMRNPDNCFLFVVKAKLGKQLKLQYADSYADTKCKKEGCDSTWGVKGPSLYNDEFIVYTLPQSRITHIIEIER